MTGCDVLIGMMMKAISENDAWNNDNDITAIIDNENE